MFSRCSYDYNMQGAMERVGGSVALYGRQQSVCEDKALKGNTHFNLTNIALLLLLIRLVNPNKGG